MRAGKGKGEGKGRAPDEEREGTLGPLVKDLLAWLGETNRGQECAGSSSATVPVGLERVFQMVIAF